MNTILVSYDLQSPGKDYSKLYDHLRSYGNFAKALESLWLIRTASTPMQVKNAAVNYVDGNDKIFVADVTAKEVAWFNLDDEVINWM